MPREDLRDRLQVEEAYDEEYDEEEDYGPEWAEPEEDDRKKAIKALHETLTKHHRLAEGELLEEPKKGSFKRQRA